jgi:hypothetical protein
LEAAIQKSRIGHAEVEEIQDIFEKDRVVHRRTLEVPAVGEDLFSEFVFQNRKAGVQPPAGFRP